MLQQLGFQIKRAVLGLSPADCILRALTATSLDCAVIELSHRTLDDTGQFISYSSSHICMPLHYHLISNTATRVLRASPLDNYNRKLEINRVAAAPAQCSCAQFCMRDSKLTRIIAFCPSVCLLHAGDVLKWLHISSPTLYLLPSNSILPVFSEVNIVGKFRRYHRQQERCMQV